MSAPTRLFIWGFGQEGRAVLSRANEIAPGAAVSVIDRVRPADLPGHAAWMDEDALPDAAADDVLLVKSPGVSLYDPRLDAALKAGARLTSQTNLYFERKPAGQRVIAVTGTKGKSTVSALIHHMLQALGFDAALAGNIGEPAILTSGAADPVVLELSSYQIADLVHAPDWVVFLNLLNDHAPWHRGVEAYRRDKARLATLDPTAKAVMNAADARLAD